MPEFDLDGFCDGLDALDDGMNHGDEFAEGFQRFDPDLPNDEEE